MNPAESPTPADAATSQVVLLSTYELGRQPFGLASPVAWLREAGFSVAPQDMAATM